MNFTYDDIVNNVTHKIIIEREPLTYLAKYIKKENTILFYEYHPDMVDELKEKYPGCVFSVNPTQ